jgi:tRNA 2-thiouridine synthesizing protein D
VNPKTLVIFLAAAPYAGESVDTALRLAEAALDKGHHVRLFASGDGVHVAQAGQRAAGVPDALGGLRDLIPRGLKVELCGSCLHIRGLTRDLLVEGAEPSSLQGLFAAVQEADVLVSFTS